MGTTRVDEPALRGRRRAAAGLLGVVCLGSLADALLGGRLVESPLVTVVIVVAGFLVGAWWSPVVAAVLVVAGSAALTAANQRAEPGRYAAADDLVFFVVLLGGCVLAGSLLAARRRQVRRLRNLSADLDRQEADASRAVAAEERRRLLVDVAAGLLGRVDELGRLADGASTGAPLRTYARIEDVARSNLEELRRVLGTLGDPDRADPPAPARRPAAVQERIGPVDVLVALAGLPVAVETVAVGLATGRSTGWLVGIAALCCVLGLPLLVRRRRPLIAVLGVAVLGGAVGALAPVADSAAALLPLSLAAYAIGAHTRGRRRWVATLVVVAVVVLVPLAVGGSGGPVLSSLVPTVAWVLVSTAFGLLAAQAADRAVRLAEVVARLEASRDQAVRLAQAEGREALARDLHDSLAHAMTVVCLHAEAAQLPGADPEQRRASMAAVAGAAHAATAELREGLAALDDGSPADDVAAVAAGLGLTPRVTLDGTVDADVAVLVRRVVRECLVNAARHAPGAQVDVRVRATDDRVTVVVETAPVGPRWTEPYAAGSGRGLSGLAALLTGSGGRLEHGPTAEGGFRVRADLPARAGRTADALR